MGESDEGGASSSKEPMEGGHISPNNDSNEADLQRWSEEPEAGDTDPYTGGGARHSWRANLKSGSGDSGGTGPFSSTESTDGGRLSPNNDFMETETDWELRETVEENLSHMVGYVFERWGSNFGTGDSCGRGLPSSTEPTEGGLLFPDEETNPNSPSEKVEWVGGDRTDPAAGWVSPGAASRDDGLSSNRNNFKSNWSSRTDPTQSGKRSVEEVLSRAVGGSAGSALWFPAGLPD